MDYWATLDASGQTDLDIVATGHWDVDDPVAGKTIRRMIEQRLDDALFLFALRAVQAAAATRRENELAAVWTRYASWWRKRLPREAWQYVRRACLEGSRQCGACGSGDGGDGKGGGSGKGEGAGGGECVGEQMRM